MLSKRLLTGSGGTIGSSSSSGGSIGSSSSSSSGSSSSSSLSSIANTAKTRIESYIRFLKDKVFRGQVMDEEIYFRVARRINQLFPNNPMGEDLELIAMCVQETASLVRFEWANKSDTKPYVLIKNIFQNLVKRSPELWDGVNKRRAMAYIIPVVFTWLSNAKTSIPDVYRLIVKSYNSIDSKYRSRPVWALTADLGSGFVDEIYETLKNSEYDDSSLLKQMTVAQSRATYSMNGLPIVLQLTRERFLERYSLLPLPVLASFGMSLQMPELNDENTVSVNKLEFLGGEPIVQSLSKDDYWYPAINRSIVPEKSRTWSSLRNSWESSKREAAILEASATEQRIRDKKSEKILSRSFSDDEED